MPIKKERNLEQLRKALSRYVMQKENGENPPFYLSEIEIKKITMVLLDKETKQNFKSLNDKYTNELAELTNKYLMRGLLHSDAVRCLSAEIFGVQIQFNHSINEELIDKKIAELMSPQE